MHLYDLPIDCFSLIFAHLDTEQICKLLEVSKFFQNIMKNERIKLNLNFSYAKIKDDYLRYFDGGIHTISLYRARISDKVLQYLTNAHTIYLESTGVTGK